MPFEVIREASQTGGGAMTSDRRLCLTEDRQTVVEPDDPRAASLLCPPGGEISASEAKRLGLALVAGRVEQRPAEQKEAEKADDKQADQPEDKAITSAEDKSGGRKKSSFGRGS